MSAVDKLAAIATRAQAATAGPWVQGSVPDGELLPDGTGSFEGYSPSSDVLAVEIDGEYAGAAYDLLTAATAADAEFIAHARQDVPVLVSALEAVLGLAAELDAESARQERIAALCDPDDAPISQAKAIRHARIARQSASRIRGVIEEAVR